MEVHHCINDIEALKWLSHLGLLTAPRLPKTNHSNNSDLGIGIPVFQVRGVLDGPVGDDSHRLQSADPERPDIRRCVLPEGQDAAGGQKSAAAADDEPAVRSKGLQRPETAPAAATAAHALPWWWTGHRRRRERDA